MTDYSKDQLDDIIKQASTQIGVDYDTLRSFAQIESNFDVNAKSSTGVRGLFQISSVVYKDSKYATDEERKNILDPRTQAFVAARYIKDLKKEFNNNEVLVASAYNAGSGDVKKALALAKTQGISFPQAMYSIALAHYGNTTQAKEKAEYAGRFQKAKTGKNTTSDSNLDLKTSSNSTSHSADPGDSKIKQTDFLHNLGPANSIFEKLAKLLNNSVKAQSNLKAELK